MKWQKFHCCLCNECCKELQSKGVQNLHAEKYDLFICSLNQSSEENLLSENVRSFSLSFPNWIKDWNNEEIALEFAFIDLNYIPQLDTLQQKDIIRIRFRRVGKTKLVCWQRTFFLLVLTFKKQILIFSFVNQT